MHYQANTCLFDCCALVEKCLIPFCAHVRTDMLAVRASLQATMWFEKQRKMQERGIVQEKSSTVHVVLKQA